LELTDVVVDGESSVFDELGKADPLIARVADTVRDGRVVEDRPSLGIAPGIEGIDDGPRSFLTDRLFLLARAVGERSLDPEERTDEAECDVGPLGIRAECFEEVPPRVRLIWRSG
jgi:hypothetical protein